MWRCCASWVVSMSWLVIIPTWGQRHVDAFRKVVFPAIAAATAGMQSEFRFIIHNSHDRDKIAEVTKGFSVEFMRVPEVENFHHCLSTCHREAMAKATRGEYIAFINADMVPSVEIFRATEARLAAGKKLVVTMGTRTLAGTELPPVGAKSADLLRWAWAHPHPWTVDCTWGSGRAQIPSVLYFQREGQVVMHGFHLHPFALVNDRPLRFGVTIDADLLEAYTHEETHIVTDADELSFAEISPRERDLGRGATPVNIQSMIRWAHSTTHTHRWLFTHPIAIIGDGSDVGDREVCSSILAGLGYQERYS